MQTDEQSMLRNSEEESMQSAKAIVARYQQRGGTLPKQITYGNKSEDEKQECQDARKLTNWKKALNRPGETTMRCYPTVAAYLDYHMPGWRNQNATAHRNLVTNCF